MNNRKDMYINIKFIKNRRIKPYLENMKQYDSIFFYEDYYTGYDVRKTKDEFKIYYTYNEQQYPEYLIKSADEIVEYIINEKGY